MLIKNTSDANLDIISMAGAVHVSVVALLCLVLHQGGVDGDASCLLLGSLVNVFILLEICSLIL